MDIIVKNSHVYEHFKSAMTKQTGYNKDIIDYLTIKNVDNQDDNAKLILNTNKTLHMREDSK